MHSKTNEKIVIDIETIPGDHQWIRDEIEQNIHAPGNYKKQETIDKWMAENRESEIEKKLHACGLKAETGQILCIGYAINNTEPTVLYGEEKQIIADFFTAYLYSQETTGLRPLLIGHNVAFDIGYIYRRALIFGVPVPEMFPRPPNLTPWSDDFFCTMAHWAGRDTISLDRLAKAFSVGGKKGIDGSMVWDLWKLGKKQAIYDYCADDVVLTRTIFNKMAN